MKKGDATKQEILAIADRLFCAKGYDETSIQDILTVMHGTKGGFYHHFPSKAAVLETLCRRRAENACEGAREDIRAQTSTVNRINTLLAYFNPVRIQEIAFLKMLLPLLERPEGMSIRVVYQEALLNTFAPLLAEEITKGTQQGVIFPVTPDLEIPLLTLENSCWLEVCMLLCKARKEGVQCSTGTLQLILAKYRRSIEVLLNAPYGSIELVQLEEWDKLAAAALPKPL